MAAAFKHMLEHAVAADPRPIAGVVGLDPAVRGDLGLAVWACGADAPLDWYAGKAFDSCTTLWLGSAVSRLCQPGERVVFAAESNAFGARVSRALGRAVGSIEGMLVDINAMTPGTLVDVSAYTWREDAGIANVKGRTALKAAAVEAALPWATMATGMPVDAAEAFLLARCVVRQLAAMRRRGGRRAT
jgi:hypothetical protein